MVGDLPFKMESQPWFNYCGWLFQIENKKEHGLN